MNPRHHPNPTLDPDSWAPPLAILKGNKSSVYSKKGFPAHPLSEVTNILYLLALVILPLFLIGWHNHRRKMTFIIYLLLADTLSISPLIGMWEQSSSLCAWARCDDSWCWLKTRYLSLPTGRAASLTNRTLLILYCLLETFAALWLPCAAAAFGAKVKRLTWSGPDITR